MTALDVGAGAILMAMAAVLVGSAAQAVTGFGFSLVAVPVLVLLFGPLHAVQLADEVAVGVNLLLLARDHRKVQLSSALQLLIPAVAVTPLAAYAVHRSDLGVLSVVIGGVIVASAAVLASGRRTARFEGRSGMTVAGAISAAMNTASGVGGPAVAMYALNAGWPLEMASPTLQIYFVGLNLLSLVALGPVRLAPGPAAGLVAALIAGVVVGTVLARRLRPASVIRAVLVLAFVGGSAAIVRGIMVA